MGLRRRAFLVGVVVLTLVCVVGLSLPRAALAKTISFSNGGTATLNGNGTITGRCTVYDYIDALGEVFPVRMPDGQMLTGYCQAYMHYAPQTNMDYDFTATPSGDGSYSVWVHSDAGPIGSRQIDVEGLLTPPQPIGGFTWTPVIVEYGSVRISKVRDGGHDDAFGFRLVVKDGNTVKRTEDFMLHGGESRKFDDIPDGYSYEVTETSGADHYETEWSRRTGKIVKDTTAEVTCTNIAHSYVTLEKGVSF